MHCNFYKITKTLRAGKALTIACTTNIYILSLFYKILFYILNNSTNWRLFKKDFRDATHNIHNKHYLGFSIRDSYLYIQMKQSVCEKSSKFVIHLKSLSIPVCTTWFKKSREK